MRNVIVILADQLRGDSVGCSGNPIVRTPHIDRIAAHGIQFTAAFAQHPQCVPSRSSLITGRYPHVNGSTSNHLAMASNEQTLPELLQHHGYFTAAIGKIHLFEEKERSSYRYTMLTGGQTSNRTTPEKLRPDYANWLQKHGYWEQVLQHYANRSQAAYRENFQAVISPLPSEAYYDTWVGDRTVEFLQHLAASKQPFYLFVGFPNPHNPFEPPNEYASMYDPDQMPLPASFHSDLSKKPPQHKAYKTHGRTNLGLNFEELTEDKLRRIIAYYYASITLVDDQIGKIMAALEATKLADDTLIVFLSDHGELLGHHGMLLKSTDAYPMLYDQSLHVPLLLRISQNSSPITVTEPVELVDLFPTITDLLGIPSPAELQGESLVPMIKGEGTTSHKAIYAESGAVKMLRGKRFKLVHYPQQEYGELYDIQEDPLEMHNLYDDPAYAHIRAELQIALLDRLIEMEAPRHGESNKGPAYWHTQYQLPFSPNASGS